MIPLWHYTGRLGNQMFQYAYLQARAWDEDIPDIYLQDEKYFKDYDKEKMSIFRQGVVNIDNVAIHVRRGDYVNNPFYVDLMKTDYYERAMELFPDEDFLVFSDDIEWCKRQDIFKGCEFSEGHNELEDMTLMSGCRGVIIANSSFSWWAGYLCRGKVVAPKSWHPDGVERTVCPKEWIRT